jgi:predicted membrane GTPase involved in stress response
VCIKIQSVGRIAERIVDHKSVEREPLQRELTQREISEFMGRLGKMYGHRGGIKAAMNMTSEQRSERARRAVNARWGNDCAAK